MGTGSKGRQSGRRKRVGVSGRGVDKAGRGPTAVPKRSSQNSSSGQAEIQCDDFPKSVYYVGGGTQSIIVSKTVRYRCGCVIVMSSFGQTECGVACDKHFQPIQRITTVEEYI